MGSNSSVEAKGSGRLRTAARQVAVGTVIAWAAVLVVALFFGVDDYGQSIGYAAFIVGALVVAVGLFDFKPNGMVAANMRGWFSRGRSAERSAKG